MKFIRQLAIIFTISFIAELMEHLIPIPVAASVYGLVLMLIGLLTKIVPLEKVEGAADFLVEIMPVLFVPPTVSIMTSAEAMKAMLVPLCVISVVSTVLIMAVTGRVSQALLRCGRKNNAMAADRTDGVGTDRTDAAKTDNGTPVEGNVRKGGGEDE